MPKKEYNIVGEKYNCYEVLEKEGANKYNKSLWRCKCDCGNEVVLSVTDLLSKRRNATGCHHKKVLSVGETISQHTIIAKISSTNWLCKCQCGKESEFSSNVLLKSRSILCNCDYYSYMIIKPGYVSSSLTVIEILPKEKGRKDSCLCLCDCGNYTTLPTDFIYSESANNVKSCGCSRYRNRQQFASWRGCGEISGRFWNNTKSGAKGRNLDFLVSIQEAWDLFLRQNRRCALTNMEIWFGQTSRDLGVASLDRIDSSKGYIEGNIQWVHKHLNKMKWDFEQDYFVQLCKRVANNFEDDLYEL